MRLYYLAHPFTPLPDESRMANLGNALRYMRALLDAGIPVVAPWIALASAYEMDKYPGGYHERTDEEFILRICVESVRRCDGLILVGPRISPGMQAEESTMASMRGRIYDATRRTPEQVVSLMRTLLGRDA